MKEIWERSWKGGKMEEEKKKRDWKGRHPGDPGRFSLPGGWSQKQERAERGREFSRRNVDAKQRGAYEERRPFSSTT